MDFYERKDSNNYGVYQDSVFNMELTKSFLWMVVGLLLSGGTSYVLCNFFYEYLSSGMIMFCIIAEMALVILLNLRLKKMSYVASVLTFIGYSILNGVTLSTIFLVYNIGSIVMAFMLSAVFFGSMAVYGLVTKNDLSSLGSMLICGLVSIVVLNIVNIFLKSSGLDLVLAYFGIAVFLGLTAYDIQRIKDMYKYNGNLVNGNMSIYAALIIYLDFINIFLRVLEILGNKSVSSKKD